MDNRERKVNLRHRGRLYQIPIYLGKLLRGFLYMSDWKMLPMSAVIAALVCMVVRRTFFVSMDGTLKGSFAFCCVAIWNGCFNSIQVICRERPIVKREHRSGMHISSYIAAHMIYQALLCIAQTIITVYVSSVCGVKFPEQGFITNSYYLDISITLFLIAFASDMLSLLVSAVSHSTTAAMTVMPFILIFQLVFSGGFFSLPHWAEKVTLFTISNYGLKCINAQANYNSLPMNAAWNALEKLEGDEVSGSFTVGQVLDLLGDEDGPLKSVRDQVISPLEAVIGSEDAESEAAATETMTEASAEEAAAEAAASDSAAAETAAEDTAAGDGLSAKDAAEEVVTEAPAEETATETPAEETATEAPAEEAATEAPEEETATEALAEETATEAPAEETATEAPVEETVTEAPAEETTEEALTAKDAAEAPAEETAAETSAEETATEAPTEETAAEAPAETAAAETAVTEAPAENTVTVGQAIDAIEQSGMLDQYRDQVIPYSFKVGDIIKIIDSVSSESLEDTIKTRTAATMADPDYDMSIDNIVIYWFILGGFALAYALIAMILLEFIDKDKR